MRTASPPIEVGSTWVKKPPMNISETQSFSGSGAPMARPTSHQRRLEIARIAASRPTARTAGSGRSEEHTSELQSLMRISYAVFCLKKKKKNQHTNTTASTHYSNHKTNESKT